VKTAEGREIFTNRTGYLSNSTSNSANFRHYSGSGSHILGPRQNGHFDRQTSNSSEKRKCFSRCIMWHTVDIVACLGFWVQV